MVSETAVRYDEQEWRPRPTLSGAEYTGEAVWAEEREKIWWGDWVCVGRTEELPEPGDYIVRNLTGESVFITPTLGGELKGFYNVCSHRGTKFLDDEPALRPRPQGVHLPLPRLGLRPRREAHRDAERQGERALRPVGLPAARVPRRDVRRLHLREPHA